MSLIFVNVVCSEGNNFFYNAIINVTKCTTDEKVERRNKKNFRKDISQSWRFSHNEKTKILSNGETLYNTPYRLASLAEKKRLGRSKYSSKTSSGTIYFDIPFGSNSIA